MTYRVIQHNYETRETTCVAEFHTWDQADMWILANQFDNLTSTFSIESDPEDCYEDEDPDPGNMDGDTASALASVGWGTDEDYGYAGDDY